MNLRCMRVGMLLGLAGLMLSVGFASAEPLLGRAIVASLRGNAHYEWEGGAEALEEGMALTHGHRVVTEGGAAMCLLLTPGALVCVHENTQLDLETLEHVSQGLPGFDGATIRRMVLRLGRGAILVHGGVPTDDRFITIGLSDGLNVETSGGSLTVANVKGRCTIDVEDGTVAVKGAGQPERLAANDRMTLSRRTDGTWDSTVERPSRTELPYDFQVCRQYFGPLSALVTDWEWGNMAALNDWINPDTEITYVGVPREWQDVSPSLRRTSESQYPSSVPPAAGVGGSGQWRRPDVWDWYRRVGTLRGVNYLPRTAVNPVEMWQADTFDPETIQQELGWAHDVGLDSVRVFVPYVVWADDAKGLKQRMEAFLKHADGHDLSTVFVLFDDRQAFGTPVRVGIQPDPVPGVYNSRWVASPGHARVPESAGEWPRLKDYVQDVIRAFGEDERVLMWDLYNEAGHSGMGEASLPLARAAFDWARDVGPSQPVTAGISRTLPQDGQQALMKLSDVVTLADYQDAHQMRAMLALAGTRGRPVICTGWLRRGRGSTFEDILPVFSQTGAGWFHWGLVKGRTQFYMPWDAAPGTPVPDMWEQDLLDAEGEPLSEEEIRLIKGFSFDDP
jgi:hypothetical protein